MQLELRRRLSRGLSANVNYQYAFAEGTSAFDGFSFGRSMIGSPNVRHAVKMQGDWTLPFGRGQKYGGSAGALKNALIGGWSFSGVGRMQTVMQDLGNVRLVGMSKSELQSMYKYYKKANPTTNVDEIWMLPDDIILNTRRAYSTSNTTLDGYSTSLGAPVGKYIAPANSASCIQVKDGDCAPRNVFLLAPWFKRFDIGAIKRFDVGGTKNFELRFDLLNAFNTPNFTPAGGVQTGGVNPPGNGANIFRVTSAYTDASNTYDPGGRIGQLNFRFSW
jgi:hypothetical protein